MESATAATKLPARPARLSSWVGRLVLMSCSTLLSLFGLELALRLKFASTRHAGLETLRQEQFVEPEGEVHLGDLVRASTDPGVVYELIPNASTVFKSKPLHVNSVGFRGPFVSLEKPENTVRILGLGDSVMFGWGVEQRESYLALLAERLKARRPKANWQAINTAVPGYNTAMQAAVLRSRGLAYRPDLVIVGYVPNDLDLPHFLLQARNPWSLSECFLADYLFRDLQPSRLLVGRRGRHDVVFNSATDLHRVPKPYRYMVGLDGFRTAMQAMDVLRQQHGFELLVFSYVGKTQHHQQIRQIVEQLEIPFLSAHARTTRYMKEQGIRKWPGSKLVISAHDPHPSAVWHDLLADTILAYLERSGLADRVAGGASSGGSTD